MKFKKGDPVINKWNSDTIFIVEKPKAHDSNDFPPYIVLQGQTKALREEDYVLVGSLEEVLRYAFIGIGVFAIVALGLICMGLVFSRMIVDFNF